MEPDETSIGMSVSRFDGANSRMAVHVFTLFDTVRHHRQVQKVYEGQMVHIRAWRDKLHLELDQEMAVETNRILSEAAKQLDDCDSAYQTEINAAQIDMDRLLADANDINTKLRALTVILTPDHVREWTPDMLIAHFRQYDVIADEDALKRDGVGGSVLLDCTSERHVMKALHIGTFGDAFRIYEHTTAILAGTQIPQRLVCIPASRDPMLWSTVDVGEYLQTIDCGDLTGVFCGARITGYVLARAPLAHIFAGLSLPPARYRHMSACIDAIKAPLL